MPTLIKVLNTRIRLRYDTLSNWTLRNPVLLAGEVAIVAVTSDSSQTAEAAVAPQILMKVGDGTSHFQTLKYTSGLSADVYAWAKGAHPGDTIEITPTAVQTPLTPGASVVSDVYWDSEGDNIIVQTQPLPGADFVSAVAESTQNGKIAVTKNGTTTQVPVHGLGSAAYTESLAYATAAQGAKADAAARTFTPEQGSEWLTIHNPENGAVTYEAAIDSSTPFVHLSIGTAPEMLKVDYDSTYIDGTLATTNKLLTKSAADGYYATAAQGTKADSAIQTLSSGNTTALSVTKNGTSYTITPNTDAVSANNGKLTTGAQVKTYVDAAIAAIGTAVVFVGVSTSDPSGTSGATVSGHTTWKKGEVVLYNNKEYINVTGSNTSSQTPNPNWKELGDEGSYALKTTKIQATNGLTITAGGTLASDTTIGIDTTTKGKIDGAIQGINGSNVVTVSGEGTTKTLDLEVQNSTSVTLTKHASGLIAAVTNVDGTVSSSNKILTQTSLSNVGKLNANNTWTGDNTFTASDFTVNASNDVSISGINGKNVISTDNGTDVVISDATADATRIYGGEIDLGSTAITVGSATNGNINLKGVTTVNGSISWATAPSNGNHLTNKTYVDGKVSGAVGALDKSDTAVSKNVVTAVSEADGIITVTRKELKATTGLTITDTSGSPTVNIDDTCVFVFNCGDSVNITE